MRVTLAVLILLLLLSGSSVDAQSPNASIRGIVLDPDSRRIPDAEIIVVNDATGVKYVTSTNGDGFYVVENLPPGPYRIQVSKFGFKGIIKPDISLNVQDGLSLNFTLPVGASSVVVTVEGGAPLVSTESAAVSTVVDRNYVENMPLNGRSFQDLILLTPGVVQNGPQAGGSVGFGGEFSVNGQRTESNYYSIDGVSANVGFVPANTNTGASGTAGGGISGSVASSTALGTTQSLVSLDALQEFRVQSSTYSAEYGRNPGGQISFATRAGTNEWHGTAFDYLRNNVFDANDWFSDFYRLPQAALRQNDFGGTLGGPVQIPRIYDGKNRTFFFFSYEGLRLVQPQPASVSYVPDAALRLSAPPAIQPILNAFPKANGQEVGNGLAQFIGSWSNPSSVDAYSFRLDHVVGDSFKFFFRFGDTPSRTTNRPVSTGQSASNLNLIHLASRTYTFGVTGLVSSRVGNDFRVNYSSNESSTPQQIDGLGGAVPANLGNLQGLTNPTATVEFLLLFPGYSAALTQSNALGAQKQWNLVDMVSLTIGRHQLRFGVDYRRLTPDVVPNTPLVLFGYFDPASVQTNSAFALAQSTSNANPVYTNFSAFAQDSWRVTDRLNLSLGLRWEINPAPGATDGRVPYNVEGRTLGSLALAPQGKPLWNTTWYNFAPRLGVVYVIRDDPKWETTIRGGGGVFFDTGQQVGSFGFNGIGFVATQSYFPAAFPLPADQANIPILAPSVPYGTVYGFSQHLQLPYSLQWSTGIQQALGKSQSLTLSYVGAHGARLLKESQVNVQPYNPDFTTIVFFGNGLTSDYNALQAQFQRKITNGLLVLASYTFSHCADYGSQNIEIAYTRGNCDYDVRHNFSSAFSYDLPAPRGNRVLRAALQHWGLDDRFTARTGYPVTLSGRSFVDPATGAVIFAGLNLVPGEPIYQYGPQYPGGKRINPSAFADPPSGQAGDAPRNFARGFGAWQMDVAIRRQFLIGEKVRLQFRAEAFNIFNHPNFGTVNSIFQNALFGQATTTLANSPGVLNPLYQQGGARSMQFALRILF